MTDSKSTDKLKLLLESIKDVLQDVLTRIVEVELTWVKLSESFLPQIKVKFTK